MAKPAKKPFEIPSTPDKPEIKPPEEEPTRTWPKKEPEIPPEKEPEREKPPYEIPPPPEE